MRFFVVIVLLLSVIRTWCQPPAQRPKIGVTLSGGGAKGLAHIGILKAIDSAGLKVDYITGTSMGGVIGALYAIGYSADSIEKIAGKIDWDLMLSNQSFLRSLFLEEKDEYGKYVVELPWINNRFRLASGVLEGQELWLKLSQLLFPAYNQKDFSQFSIPFRCIGTDVGSGEAVVLSNGEIINAIRSSMAIPSLFTAVDYNGKRLVDGGIVRNFPVRDVKEMGADIVIGSNVAAGLLPSDKVRNVLQVLLQIAFFREAEDNRNEVPACDIYVPMSLDKYTMGSFGQSNEIIQVGIEEGRKLYPRIRKIVDSLDAIYGSEPFVANRLPQQQAVTISAYEVTGLEKTSSDFFVHTMDFTTDRRYTASQLAEKVRRAFGTRYYTRITYSLEPLPDSTAKIKFAVEENPLTFAKLGLHYNRFSGISIIANITSRNFFVRNSRNLATINIGESFRLRGEHLQYMGRKKATSLVLGSQFDRFDITSYDQFKESGLYRQNYFKVDEKLQFSGNRQLSAGIGHRFELISYRPSLTKNLALKGHNSFSTLYSFFNFNSLDRALFSHRGIKIEAEGAWVLHQHPQVDFYFNDVIVTNPDTIDISDKPYPRISMNFDSYLPLSSKSVVLFNVQAGVNFDYTRNIANEFVVGGLTRMYHNQVLFAGLDEGTVNAPTLLVTQAGYRFEIFNNVYMTARANALFTNFISKSDFFRNKSFFSGYSATFSYNFALGPLDLSVMYCDQTQKFRSYINLGIPF